MIARDNHRPNWSWGPFRITAVEAPGEEVNLLRDANNSGLVAQLGYLVEDTVNDFTIYAIGDLRVPYPELIECQNEANLVLCPIGKPFGRDGDPLEYQMKFAHFVVDLIQPRYIVPHHYLHDGEYPVPQDFDDTDPIEVSAHRGNWFPTVENPAEHITALREKIAGSNSVDAEVLPFRAGITHRLV